jgi:hypothetical protein
LKPLPEQESSADMHPIYGHQKDQVYPIQLVMAVSGLHVPGCAALL